MHTWIWGHWFFNTAKCWVWIWTLGRLTQYVVFFFTDWLTLVNRKLGLYIILTRNELTSSSTWFSANWWKQNNFGRKNVNSLGFETCHFCPVLCTNIKDVRLYFVYLFIFNFLEPEMSFIALRQQTFPGGFLQEFYRLKSFISKWEQIPVKSKI